MGLISVQRRRSRAWGGLFLFALLAVGLYIAFEVLDLDGSELSSRLFGTAVAAEPARAETERLLHQAPGTREIPGLLVLSVTLPPVSESSQVAPRRVLATLAALWGCILPRAHLSREASSTDSQLNDPA